MEAVKTGAPVRVTLLACTPGPEAVVATAARLCYSEAGTEEIMKELDGPEMERLIRMLIRMGHHSPLEHASFTFEVCASRVSLNQLLRHRIASYSQRSQRYVREDDFAYVVPPSVRDNREALARFRAVMEEVQQAYNDLVGMGIPQEDARYCLTNATYSRLVCTFNARELRHIVRLRTCKRAQWEIRSVAYMMLREARRVAPALFFGAGPSCLSDGICHEGKLSCGRIERLRRRPRRGEANSADTGMVGGAAGRGDGGAIRQW